MVDCVLVYARATRHVCLSYVQYFHVLDTCGSGMGVIDILDMHHLHAHAILLECLNSFLLFLLCSLTFPNS